MSRVVIVGTGRVSRVVDSGYRTCVVGRGVPVKVDRRS